MKSKAKIILLIFFLVLLNLVVFVRPVSAALDQGLVPCGHTDPMTGTITNPCELKHLILIVIRIINMLLGFSWLIATFFIFWGGWTMVTSWGNAEGIQKGKDIFSQAIIGFFLVMVSFILLNFVVAAFTGNTFTLDPNAPNSILKFLPYP